MPIGTIGRISDFLLVVLPYWTWVRGGMIIFVYGLAASSGSWGTDGNGVRADGTKAGPQELPYWKRSVGIESQKKQRRFTFF